MISIDSLNTKTNSFKVHFNPLFGIKVKFHPLGFRVKEVFFIKKQKLELLLETIPKMTPWLLQC